MGFLSSLRFLRYVFPAGVAVFALSACAPDPKTIATSVPPTQTVNQQDSTDDHAGGAAPSQLSDLPRSPRPSKIDPSASFINQQSLPLAGQLDLSVLDRDGVEVAVDEGVPLSTLQDRPPAGDEIDEAIEWIFTGELPVSTTSDIAVTDQVIGAQRQTGTPSAPASEPEGATADDSPATPALDLAALEAVFQALDRSGAKDSPSVPLSIFPPKAEGEFRVAVILPLSGRYKALGEDLRKAVDLAVLTSKHSGFEAIFIDSEKGGTEAATIAVAASADMIIGPLFASRTYEVSRVAAENHIPVLSFSNTRGVSSSGTWILGRQPEQEIEAVLSYALANPLSTKPGATEPVHVALVTDDNAYGRKLRGRARQLLTREGVTKLSELLLSPSTLNDEASLRQTIQRFSAPDETGLPRRFDIIVFCGGLDFTLRVAPVLVWHDLDPASVQFVGPSQWNRHEAVNEPSLQGAIFASPPQQPLQRFNQIWRRYYGTAPSAFAPMGFDAVAIATMIAKAEHPQDILVRPTGFSGFSGVFRLTPDGGNDRQIEIRRIINGESELLRAAGASF